MKIMDDIQRHRLHLLATNTHCSTILGRLPFRFLHSRLSQDMLELVNQAECLLEQFDESLKSYEQPSIIQQHQDGEV